jgi:anti-anti-sigma regulatory factor
MQSAVLLGRERDPHRSGHLCSRFQGQDEFASQARDFLADGLARGQRVLFVGRGDLDGLVGRLRPDSVFADGFGRGAVQVASLEATYPFGAAVEPEEQVRNYAAATDAALAAGFTGLRVAADATPLVRTATQLSAFARYEHLVDRYMATHPMAAMCAYDRDELDDDAIALLASLHPRATEGSTSFHLHGSPHAGISAALTGELDAAAQHLWPRALERADLRPVDGAVVIDATGLTFISHRNLLALADYADRHRTTVVLRTRVGHPARVLQLLGVTSVRVEQVA